ncbi:Asp-tRNA(Asn)/Glu-tRNA(Gln) amidotransferase subunit GatA [Candidatus Dojkabacteria bacterium]|nr:Asp-tRNA(Asn)/Glu-tRNA(Gln) amidotransferase subunit GatA [Candidatus Dojkabacteria bacterium]
MKLENLTIKQLLEAYENGDTTPKEAIEYYFGRIEAHDSDLNSYITVNSKILDQLDSSSSADKKGKLAGIPIAVKDVVSTQDLLTTCASHILDGYKPTFESTITQRILDEGALILGKTNLDEFCHGSSTETSYYGPSRNPWDTEKLPGGSSGGSAAATVADLCPASLGTETAGSLRQPASWCGCVGFKPTYGRVSRYGIIAMGSSLDSPGPLTKNVEDAAIILGVIAGKDKNDFTTSDKEVPDYAGALSKDAAQHMKFGIPKSWMELEIEEGIRKSFYSAVEILKSAGAEVVEVDMIDAKYAIAVYTLICRSEVSSNLSRFDGTRYGLSLDEQKLVFDYYEKVRGEGFGEEAKRRVMTGTFSLSAGYADEYFKIAEKCRRALKADVLNILQNVDAIIAPTTPVTAMKVGEASKNPLFGEMMDVFAETSSLSGLPGISIPCGFSDSMPVGFQFFSRHFEEQLLLDAAYFLESELNLPIKSPI